MSNSELLACPLDWRVPDEDELGHENGVLTALGIGGSYDIGEQSDGYILWWAADPFTFQEGFATIGDAKAAAEADWQKSIAAVLTRTQPDELRAENERLKGALFKSGVALNSLIECVGGTVKSRTHYRWNRLPTFEEVQAAMEANNQARKALGGTNTPEPLPGAGGNFDGV